MAKFLDSNGVLYFWQKLRDKLNTKVTKETGKALIAETEIQRLKNVNNYDDTAVQAHMGNDNKHVSAEERNRWDAAAAGGLTEIPPEYITETELAAELAPYAKTTALSSYYTKTEVDAKTSSAMKYKGTVATYAELPNNAQIGDVYNITAKSANNKAGDNAVWNGTGWDVLSGTVDLSGYVQHTDAISNSEIDTIVAS